jgi:6,7-dimethyl-8-ribityllumazine synthase
MSNWRPNRGGESPLAQSYGARMEKGARNARGRRVAVVAAEFNDSIVARLVEGAVAAWVEHGGAAQELLIARVPGAFELPVAALRLAQSKGYEAIVALGCVIRGDTPHFEYVAGECARGLQQVACTTGVPVAFGVLTTENAAQAEERASPGAGNKGREAM